MWPWHLIGFHPEAKGVEAGTCLCPEARQHQSRRSHTLVLQSTCIVTIARRQAAPAQQSRKMNHRAVPHDSAACFIDIRRQRHFSASPRETIFEATLDWLQVRRDSVDHVRYFLGAGLPPDFRNHIANVSITQISYPRRSATVPVRLARTHPSAFACCNHFQTDIIHLSYSRKTLFWAGWADLRLRAQSPPNGCSCTCGWKGGCPSNPLGGLTGIRCGRGHVGAPRLPLLFPE